MQSESKFLTVDEAAQLVRLSHWTIRLWLYKGHLTRYKAKSLMKPIDKFPQLVSDSRTNKFELPACNHVGIALAHGSGPEHRTRTKTKRGPKLGACHVNDHSNTVR